MALTVNPTGRQADIGFAAILVGVSVWAFFEAGSYPGFAGAYPQVIAALLALASAVMVIRALKQPEIAERHRLFVHAGRFVLGVATLVLYILGIDVLGYIIPSLIVGIAVPFMLGFRNFPLTLAVTAGTLITIVLVFFVALGRPLPPDVLDPMLELLR